jgi:hypothetical protein
MWAMRSRHAAPPGDREVAMTRTKALLLGVFTALGVLLARLLGSRSAGSDASKPFEHGPGRRSPFWRKPFEH